MKFTAEQQEKNDTAKSKLLIVTCNFHAIMKYMCIHVHVHIYVVMKL